MPANLFHPGTCARCGGALDLRGRPHLVGGALAADAIRDSPVPVVLVFASRWKGSSGEEHTAVEALARSLSGEVTVLVADILEDVAALSVYQSHGCPRAVLLSKGNEIGRGKGLPREGPVRFVLARALPRSQAERVAVTA